MAGLQSSQMAAVLTYINNWKYKTCDDIPYVLRGTTPSVVTMVLTDLQTRGVPEMTQEGKRPGKPGRGTRDSQEQQRDARTQWSDLRPGARD